MQSAFEKPSVKQHLAAIRMLFDWLVTGQIVATNPALAVRGPTHVVKTGKIGRISRLRLGHRIIVSGDPTPAHRRKARASVPRPPAD